MELAAILTVGILIGAGVYLLLQRSLLRVALGTGLVSQGVNLLLLTSGKLKRGGAPLLPESGTVQAAAVTDPLPQALILTAIVIGFGTTALLLAIAYRTFQERGSDDLDALRGVDDE